MLSHREERFLYFCDITRVQILIIFCCFCNKIELEEIRAINYLIIPLRFIRDLFAICSRIVSLIAFYNWQFVGVSRLWRKVQKEFSTKWEKERGGGGKEGGREICVDMRLSVDSFSWIVDRVDSQPIIRKILSCKRICVWLFFNYLV